MANVMIVKVKYYYQGYTLSTDRFTDRTGERKKTDSKRVAYDYGGDISKLNQAAKYIETHTDMRVIGRDGWGKDEGYLVLAPNDEGLFSPVSEIKEA